MTYNLNNAANIIAMIHDVNLAKRCLRKQQNSIKLFLDCWWLRSVHYNSTYNLGDVGYTGELFNYRPVDNNSTSISICFDI